MYENGILPAILHANHHQRQKVFLVTWKNYLSYSGAFFAYRINFSYQWHSFHWRDTMWKFWIQKKEREKERERREDIPLYHKGRVRQPFRMRFYWGKESSISVFTLRGNQKAIMMRIEEEKEEKNLCLLQQPNPSVH